MKNFEGIADSSTEVRSWLIRNEDKVPEHLADRMKSLTATGTSPVDLIVQFTEAVYANPKDFPKEARDLASGASVVAEAHNFHGFATDQRGSRIAKILDGGTVAKDKMPEPKSDMAAPADEPPAEG